MLQRNHLRQKTNRVYTPLPLCEWLSELILSVYEPNKILDPCSGSGNLTKYFDCDKIEFEIDRGTNFFEQQEKLNDVDLVLCNPPFISGDRRTNSNEKFLKHIQKVVPEGTPIVFFCPFNFRLNNRKNSKRLRYLEMLNITSTIVLPTNIFPNTIYHTEILILNLPQLKPHYTYVPPLEKEMEMSEAKTLEELDLNFETDEEAELLIAAIRKEQQRKRELRVDTVKARIEAVLLDNGFNLGDLPEMFGLSGSIKQPKKTIPKFVINGEFWTGRGKSLPDFVEEELDAKGITIEELKDSKEYRNPEHDSYESDFKGS